MRIPNGDDQQLMPGAPAQPAPPPGKGKRIAMRALSFLIYWLACVAFLVGGGLLSLSWIFLLTGFGGVAWVFNAITQDRWMSIFIAPIIVFTISAAVTIRARRKERR